MHHVLYFALNRLTAGAPSIVTSPTRHVGGFRPIFSSLAGLQSLRAADAGRGSLFSKSAASLSLISEATSQTTLQTKCKRIGYVPLEREARRLRKYTESRIHQISGHWSEDYGSKINENGKRVSCRIAARA